MQLIEVVSDESAIVKRYSLQVLIWICPPVFDKQYIRNLLLCGKYSDHSPPDIDGHVVDSNRDTIQLSKWNFKRKSVYLVGNMYHDQGNVPKVLVESSDH